MGRRVGVKKVHLGVIELKGKYHRVCRNDPNMLMLLYKQKAYYLPKASLFDIRLM